MKGGAFFAYENQKFLVVAPGNLIIGESLKLIFDFLMTIGYYALRKFYMGGGIEGELKVNRLELLPIPMFENYNTKEDIYKKLKLNDDEIKEIEKYKNNS